MDGGVTVDVGDDGLEGSVIVSELPVAPAHYGVRVDTGYDGGSRLFRIVDLRAGGRAPLGRAIRPRRAKLDCALLNCNGDVAGVAANIKRGSHCSDGDSSGLHDEGPGLVVADFDIGFTARAQGNISVYARKIHVGGRLGAQQQR